MFYICYSLLVAISDLTVVGPSTSKDGDSRNSLKKKNPRTLFDCGTLPFNKKASFHMKGI